MQQQRKYIPVTVRDAVLDDLPQIYALVQKFSKPDPITGEINIWTPPSEELLNRIIEAKECVVAESEEQEEKGKILAYNLRRSQTADASVGFIHGFAKSLEKMQMKMPIGDDVDEDEDEDLGPNPYKGSKISFANQTVVDECAQGSNVIDELTLGFAKQMFERFGQSYVLGSILKSNEKSMKMSLRMGATVVGEYSKDNDGTNNVAIFASPDVKQLISMLEPSVAKERASFLEKRAAAAAAAAKKE